MAALFNELICHHYQRRICSFQVGRQQCNNAPVCRITIKQVKGFGKTFLVEAGIFYQVFTVDGLCGAAAFKNGSRRKLCGGNRMCFKKANGQVRYFV